MWFTLLYSNIGVKSKLKIILKKYEKTLKSGEFQVVKRLSLTNTFRFCNVNFAMFLLSMYKYSYVQRPVQGIGYYFMVLLPKLPLFFIAVN